MKVLAVIDMQNDFIDGALGTKEAQEIVPRVVERIREFDGLVLATRDTHADNYMETQEGAHLPVMHCIQGTRGWEIRHEIAGLLTEEPVNKPGFGSLYLSEKLQEYHRHKEPIESITLIGLCTDICVISNAMLLKAYLPEVPVIVDASCCAGVTPKSHSRALEAMKMCHIDIINE